MKTRILRSYLICLGVFAIFVALFVEFARQRGLVAELIVNYHPKMYRLHEILHYGLQGDAFDPLSDYVTTNINNKHYDNPMINLRNICQNIHTQCEITSNRRIFCYPHFTRFEGMIISQTLFMEDNLYLKLFQHFPSLLERFIPSILNYMNTSQNIEDRNTFKGINMLAKLLNTNCFVDFKSGEESRNNSLTISKTVFYKNRNKNTNAIELFCRKYPFIIVGGSISGLTIALTAIDSGIPAQCIEIYEKRDDYRREIVFDIYDKPKYDSIKVLHKFGFGIFQSIPMDKQRYTKNSMYYGVQTRFIERFLAKIAFIQGCNIHYSHELVDLKTDNNNNNNNHNVLVFKNKDNNYVRIKDYSAIFGCDGFKSQVRNLFNINYETQNTIYDETDMNDFTRFGRKLGSVSSIHQTSIIVDYRLQLRKLLRNRPMLVSMRENPPDAIGFQKPHFAELVFPRCHGDKCQLQLLFNGRYNKKFNTEKLDVDKANGKIFQTMEKEKAANGGEIDWKLGGRNKNNGKKRQKFEKFYQLSKDMIKNATNLVFDEPDPEIYLDFLTNWQIRKNEIILAKESLIRVENSNDNNNDDDDDNLQNQFVFLIGESAMSAHYRLGIGTNTILDGHKMYQKFFQFYWRYYDCIYANKDKQLSKSCNEEKMNDFVLEFNDLKSEIEIRLKKRSNYQATYLFLEVNCNYTIRGSPIGKFGIEYDNLLKRNYKRGEFEPAGFGNNLDAVQDCFDKLYEAQNY